MILHRRFAPTLLLAALGLAASIAAAAPRDAAAKKKIDEAINMHYLQTDFDGAESVLLGVVKACEDKCSPNVKAAAWMYVGIVRGSGRLDTAGATDAFLQAVLLDPEVKLDEALATDETRQAFETAKSQGGEASAAPTPTPEPTPPASPAAPARPIAATMQCTPTVRELETRRAIPISCDTAQPAAAKGVIFFKEFGGDDWKEVPMQKKGTSLQGTVPCEATTLAGNLLVYVEARDAQNNVVDTNGTRPQPIEFSVLGTTSQPPPAFPGMEAPPRCSEQADCPPDFPGCKGNKGNKDWGDSCAANDECQTNLCLAGSCDFCQSDEDCAGKATCDDGYCSGGSGADAGQKGGSGKMKKSWLGLHFAADVPVVGGEKICTRASQEDGGWNCFYAKPVNWDNSRPELGAVGENVQYPYDPYKDATGKVNPGFALSTLRALFSFDYALTQNLTLGARAGFAFNGGPKAAGNSFLPVHAEGRLTYWFVPLSEKGIRPYVHLGGGLGQVDAKVKVNVYDCNSTTLNGQLVPQYQTATGGYEACLATGEGKNPIQLDAYRRMGKQFVAPGFGVVYAFSPRAGLELNVDAKIFFPVTGFAPSPSLGFVYGL